MPTKGASKRSSTTCAECRARKVRCDGKREICSGCERLKLNCSFSRRDTHVDGIAQPDASLSGRKKKTACIRCRSLKAKCGGELPSCMRCLRKRTPCRYPSSNRLQDGPIEARRAFSQTRDVTTEPTGQARIEEAPPALDSTFVLRMFEAFFQHVHPIPVYSYFHKASLVQRFESGLLNHTLVLALAGTTCELLDMGADLTQKSTMWMSHAELGVMKELGRPSVIKVQALVLLVMHHMRQGRLGNAFMLHAVASRSAFALGLNYEAPKLGFLACESRRRLMWSLYIIDNRLAGGMSDFAICSASSIHVQLPCHERNFEFDLPQITKHLTPACVDPLPESIGSLAVYIQLMWYRHRVLQTTKEAVLNSAMTMDRLTTSIEQLGNELSTFEMNLPESLKFSSKSLQLRAYSTRLGPYLLIHVWLRQCQCDLYRIALTGLKEAMPGERLQQIDHSTIESWRRNCLSNAMILASVFSQFTTLKNGCPVVEHDVIICAYQCARLLLHCSKHYSSVLQIDRLAVLDNASQCLAAIQAIPSRSHIGESITQDLTQLLQRGSSPGPQTAVTEVNTEPHVIPLRLETSQNSHHLFSRHSAIGQIQLNDEDSGVTSLSVNARTTTQDTVLQPVLPALTMAPVHDTSDFDISNAFEGAFDDLDLGINSLDWSAFPWPGANAVGRGHFGMHTWNG